MTIFWIAVAAMAVATAAALLAAVGRGDARSAPDDHDQAVYRAQLKDVDEDLRRGVIAEGDAETARNEVRRRLLAAADRAPSALFSLGPVARWTSRLIVGLGVPAAGLVLYLTLGAPGVPDQPLAERGDDVAQVREMEGLLRQLEDRLATTPTDVTGWLLLGRSYQTLGHLPESARAFARAVEASGRSPDTLAEYGEALMAAEDGQVTAAAQAIFEEAAAKDSSNARSRYYLGLAKAQAGDAAGALASWVDVVKISPDDAAWLPMVRERIREMASALNVAPPAEAEEPASAPGPSPAEIEAAARLTAEDRAGMVRGMVDGLAARLEKEPDDLDGWLRLARAYEVLGEIDKAKSAFARAEALRTRRPGPTR